MPEIAEPWTLGPVVVTGGTGHVGMAIARAFLAAGATTIAIGSNPQRTEAAGAELAAHGKAHVMAADISEPDNVRLVLDDVEQRFGTPAVLVNGAGINFHRLIRDLTSDEFDLIFKVNVKSMLFMSREACERMGRAQIRGRVVNITSGNYRYARPDAALYSATKAAMEMLTRGLALEYGHSGIAINAVAPGLVDRPGTTDPAFLKVADYYRGQSANHVLATPEAVAGAVMFLSSAAAQAIAGDTIVIDGGFSAGRLDFPRRSS
ncbi:SDR family NAD(P)-dependent oxidoreductase [Chelatococcus asaccharovorans]|uniref:3-oxoacyl-[acyl-carrier protein] reductase n=1 Tax=Chelatococcus asaccharovorans TaxID=28210 RepID=A0A2V3TYJ9_9HYPH|nr:SDR family oxidoreductase [Chelatococcus asaccharovorans]MBS7707538.1 SDR family oxidoreductase [Chelatococcus asaccharovorans]PXW54141.1 3-oxoacyl-[acyl-carrier protein] reductase [Chelatococcus asaccharovorans]